MLTDPILERLQLGAERSGDIHVPLADVRVRGLGGTPSVVK
jgi:hypothetical protein